jgi:YD repeat-containing protein
MKRIKVIIKVLFIIVLFFVNNLHGQNTNSNFIGDGYFFPVPALPFNTSRDVFPTSPKVASLGVFGQIPVGNFTGTAQISIPLYEIKYKELSVPIQINYQALGNKPDVFPGPVGLGWAIQAGGFISRQINGESDMGHPMSSDNELSLLLSDPRGGSTWPDMTTVFTYLQQTSIVFDNTIDINPDEYNFNINGHTGKFYLNHKDTFQIQSAQGGSFLIIKHPRTDHTVTFPVIDHFPPKLPTLSELNTYSSDKKNAIIAEASEFYGVNPYLNEFEYTNQVYIPANIGGFTMIDSNGIKYIFGATDGSNKSDKSIEFSRPGFETDNYNITTIDGYTYLEGYVQPLSWQLTAIESPQGYKIEFVYEQECYILKTRFSDLALFRHPSNPNLRLSNNARTEDGERTTFINGCYLKEINFPSGKISFSNSEAYNQLSHVPSTSYDETNEFIKLYSYPDIRFANTDRIVSSYDPDPTVVSKRFFPHKIDSITVSDPNNGVIKTINFTYNNDITSRLKLMELTMKGSAGAIQKYSFEYNPLALPGYMSGKTDHYGFYNGTELFLNPNNITSTLLNNSNYIHDKKASSTQFIQAEMLNKIIYPTKGYTVFEYEPHDYSKICKTWPFEVINNTNGNQKTGGVRIKSKKNYDANNTLLSENRYHYVTNYLNGESSSSGILAYVPKYAEIYNNKQIWYGTTQASTLAEFYRFSTTSLYNMTAPKGNHITYSEVTVEEPGNGFTVYKYKNHDNGYGDKEPLFFCSNILKDAATQVDEELWKADEGMSMEMERGQLLSEVVFDNNKNRKKKIVYTYRDDEDRFDENVRYVKLNSNSIRFTGYHSQRLTAGVHYTYFPYLKEKKEITYIGSDSVTQKENYTYDERYRLIKTIKKSDSQNKEYITEISYTVDQDTTIQIVKQMLGNQMMAYPFVETTKFPNNKTKKNIFKYKKDWTSLQVPMLHQKAIQQDNNPELLDTEITSYDSYGNPNGIYERTIGNTCILWGYKAQHPIAEIENATYDQVKSILGETLINRVTGAVVPSNADMTAINNLRSNTNMSNAYVTTYTYKPLIGMTSKTDPRGFTIYYDYDAFGRLKESYFYENGTKKVLETYDYHYKDQ